MKYETQEAKGPSAFLCSSLVGIGACHTLLTWFVFFCMTTFRNVTLSFPVLLPQGQTQTPDRTEPRVCSAAARQHARAGVIDEAAGMSVDVWSTQDTSRLNHPTVNYSPTRPLRALQAENTQSRRQTFKPHQVCLGFEVCCQPRSLLNGMWEGFQNKTHLMQQTQNYKGQLQFLHFLAE